MHHIQFITHSVDFRVSCTKWPCLFLTTATQKSLKTFNFPEFHQHAKNQFISSIHSWDTFNFWVMWPDWSHPLLITLTPQIFWSTFNLCEFVSTCKKSGYLIDVLWSYGWLKNYTISLAENILAHISRTKIFSNVGFV